MLAADKLLLQSNLKLRATELKEKEFRLHHDNFQAVGTQAAVLAGFAVAALVELEVPKETPRAFQLLFFTSCISALCLNLQCVASTTTVVVLGSSLALRGPDGSMLTAVESMFSQRRKIFTTFAAGVIAVHSTAFWAACIVMELEAAIACCCLVLVSLVSIITSARAHMKAFNYDESQAVTFDDIFSSASPANISIPSIPSIQQTLNAASETVIAMTGQPTTTDDRSR